jgi:serine protease Do
MGARAGLRLAAAGSLVVLAACGGGGGQPLATPTATPTATATPQPTETAAESGAVNTLDGVQGAAVQIVAEGSFVDPEVGLQLNAAGAGSGFIIDPSGIAITNNHVVTGSALLRVYVGGEDRPRNARILGASECSDLAVIDIDGDDYPYLEWYDGEIKTGLEVYAAGFPLGDPEYTLTRGIVSKARADGETNWASVDRVIEHDATVNPGNSGGALVTAEGRVVGVNYAGSSDTNQHFAITRDEAAGLVDQLRSGADVTSIGVNGTAVSDGESLSGIWVASVKSGSPADRAGIIGGDIITKLEGLVLATDGTMSDYCDILRSRSPGDVMSLEVLRFATGEVLEGQLNGRELVTTFSFASTLSDELPVEEGTAYRDYVSVSDATGAIQLDVPAGWSDVDPDPLGGGLPALSAAPDLAGFNERWDVPGVLIAASSQFDAGAHRSHLADFEQSAECTSAGIQDYDDGLYTGLFEVWEDCGGTDTAILTVSAAPSDGSFVVFVVVQIVTEADLEATDQIVATFQVVGSV